MKKIFLICLLFFGLYNFSYATITVDSPVLAGSAIDLSCDTGTTVFFFTYKGAFLGAGNCGSATTLDVPNDYVLLECMTGNCGETLAQARLSPDYVSEVPVRVLASELTTQAIPKSIFYSRDPETETSTASNLVAMAGDATGLTAQSLGGILGVVGGIIAGFGVILYIISLFNEAKEKKDKNNRL